MASFFMRIFIKISNFWLILIVYIMGAFQNMYGHMNDTWNRYVIIRNLKRRVGHDQNSASGGR
ncbi:hypothetical protein QF049_005529 [Paenibacillus sp. W4I10]|nr:hypothetical protein [Paenibacillus sp. W4I10]